MVTDVYIKTATKPKYFNCYVVEVEYMHGDADHYQTEEDTFGVNKRQDLIDYLNFLERCLAEYPYGRGGSDDYDHIPGYDEMVSSWPCDDCGIQASLEGYEVFFYDSTGTKHDCEVVNEQQ